MITGYRISGDDIYLYIDFSYEFALDVSTKKKDKHFMETVKNYLKDKHIGYRGKRVVLVSNGIIIGSLLLGGFLASEAKLNEQVLLNSTNTKELVVDKTLTKYDNIFDIIDLPNSLEDKKQEESNNASTNIENNEAVSKEITANKNTEVKDESKEVQTSKTEKPKENSSESKQSETKKETSTEKKETSTKLKEMAANSEIKQNVTTATTTTKESNTTKEQVATEEEKTYVTVHRSSGSIEKIELEQYLIGVVAAEMPASFNEEALKAQAIAARTYTLKRLESGKAFTDNESTQSYKDTNQLKALWGSSYNYYYNRVKNAVTSTEGYVITYNNTYIDAVYHSMSNGYTEDVRNVWGNNVPYLKSVESLWDLQVLGNEKSVIKDLNTVTNVLGIDLSTAVLVINRNESGRIETIVYDNIIYSGTKLRELFGLRSSDITITVSNNNVIFTTKGYGHGVGMSQYGANGMAKEGYSAIQILKYYYTGVSVVKQ